MVLAPRSEWFSLLAPPRCLLNRFQRRKRCCSAPITQSLSDPVRLDNMKRGFVWPVACVSWQGWEVERIAILHSEPSFPSARSSARRFRGDVAFDLKSGDVCSGLASPSAESLSWFGCLRYVCTTMLGTDLIEIVQHDKMLFQSQSVHHTVATPLNLSAF